MLFSVKSYIDLLNDTEGLTKTLGVIDVCRREDGQPFFIVGNNSVVFKIRREGRFQMLKCYTRPKRNLQKIYGDAFLPRELFVSGEGFRGEWVDAVLCDWVEGQTLRRVIADSSGDTGAFARLAAEFDRMALDLACRRWAHGDLKPDNIIVAPDGSMHLIDFDAVCSPGFDGECECEETGTTAYQHPLRISLRLFDKSVDDYPAALISVALHALSADAHLHERFETDEFLLIDPREAVAGRSAALDAVSELFADRCMPVPFRMAELLRSRVPKLAGLRELLEYANMSADGSGRIPELAVREGLWGYTLDGRFVIPPLYDEGFEFSDGLAAVRLGECRHFITPDGRSAINCRDCEAVKSFADGYAVVFRHGERTAIDKSGAAADPPPAKETPNLLISVK